MNLNRHLRCVVLWQLSILTFACSMTIMPLACLTIECINNRITVGHYGPRFANGSTINNASQTELTSIKVNNSEIMLTHEPDHTWVCPILARLRRFKGKDARITTRVLMQQLHISPKLTKQSYVRTMFLIGSWFTFVDVIPSTATSTRSGSQCLIANFRVPSLAKSIS